MRVTQAMLSNSTLSHISNGYSKLATTQDQLATGKKITRASQDPVVAMKGMRYRTQVLEVDQFKRNLGEVYNWLETADEALDQGTQVLQRIRELATQASNDTYNETERANISKEVKQLREHLQSLANTKNSNKYIFNGTNTTTAPVIDMEKMNYSITDLTNGSIANPDSVDLVYNGKTFRHSETTAEGVQIFEDISNADNQLTVSADGQQAVFSKPNMEDPTAPRVEETLRTNDVVVANRDSISINTQNVEIELMKGVTVPVNVNPANVFSNALFGDIIRLEKALEDGNVKGPELTGYIDNMFGHINQFVSERAELGARVNRIEMMENRLMGQEVTAKRIMSDNEDADMEQVIIDLTTQESVHRAALASGARIIQPTLMDFLR
ncbi:flagellar hook-associated protein FlgL [Bacillus suaedae]|uniref:Flagellar hook-associated protein FlgL n=1 Tax=Halalkalibacter suaedae TaxID=2822140 RepID=A0A941ASV1_9BACI|nr:flagellar hook-associated protein FlgL [Bacillus suaedae]MBP3950039.1 flagellar hook-associated protein FlgL [Bacillus suaedae]